MVTRNRGNRDDVDIYHRGTSMSSTAQKESVFVFALRQSVCMDMS